MPEKLKEGASVPPVEPHTARMEDSQAGISRFRWWRVADLFVFGIWACLVTVILRHHEPWADESQAWLIARDLDLRTIWFHELRYEGTPGLWHTILWVAQHWFHAPYAAMGIIGAVCAAAGVALILWKSPFPRPLSYLLVFSYVLVYQYAVVARSYNLLPLLVFAVAHFYKDKNHPVRMTVALILLANVAVHGILIAVSFGLGYLIEAFKAWPGLSKTVRTRYAFCIAAMLLTFAFLFFILWPTPDVGEFSSVPPGFHRPGDPALMKFEAVIDLSFFDQTYISALFLLLAGAWCFMRRKLLPFALSISLLILLYVTVHGRPHHHGTVFLAAIAGLWIAWPTEEESHNSSHPAHLATYGMTALLVCLFCLNIWDAEVAMKNDYLYPYSGSLDAAHFLKKVGADKTTICGYAFGISALQAYFDHDIMENIPTTYYHQGSPMHGGLLDASEIQTMAPEYVVVYGGAGLRDFQTVDPLLQSLGYNLVHLSRGYMFYKRFVFDTADYFIYQRPMSGQF